MIRFERQTGYKMPAYATDKGRRRAEDVSRRAYYTDLAAMLQSRLNDVLGLCYDTGPGGFLLNVDDVTGRILVPVPWSSHNHRDWGLWRSEADIMRLCLRHLRTKQAGPFWFDKDARRWALDLGRYPALESIPAPARTIDAPMVMAADHFRRAHQ
jgi:hypothetical protein